MRRADAAQNVAPVRLDDLDQRRLEDPAFRLDVFEDRGLRDLRADDETDDHEDDARQERHPPRPVSGQVDADQEDEVREQEADGEARLHDPGERALPPPRCVFVSHQDRAAPLGAEGEPLDDAHRHQQDRREDPHGGVGGEQADHERRETHDDQGGHQHGLASDAVAEVTPMMPPIGRAANPTPRVAKERRVPVSGSPPGKNAVPKYSAAAVPKPMKS